MNLITKLFRRKEPQPAPKRPYVRSGKYAKRAKAPQAKTKAPCGFCGAELTELAWTKGKGLHACAKRACRQNRDRIYGLRRQVKLLKQEVARLEDERGEDAAGDDL